MVIACKQLRATQDMPSEELRQFADSFIREAELMKRIPPHVNVSPSLLYCYHPSQSMQERNI